MKFITLICAILAWVVVVAANILEGGNPAVLFSEVSPLLLVFGGTMVLGVMGSKGSDIGGVVKAMMRAMIPKNEPKPAEMSAQLVSYAETARRDGLLALESASKEITDPFVRQALEMIIDGTDEDTVYEILESDISALQERHKVAQGVFTAMGGYAPTLGILGTVMGMMHVLDSLGEVAKSNSGGGGIAKMASAIAIAFLATLWGVGSANLIWLPIAAKLKRLTSSEVAYRRMVLDGVLSIQGGSSPRQVNARLQSHLSPSQRDGGGGKGKKSKDKGGD